MKVLFLVTAFPRTEADVITPWLAEAVKRLKDRSITVEVLAPAYRGLGNQHLDGVQVHRFRYAPRRFETLTHDQTAPDRIRERPIFLGLVPLYVVAGSLAAARLARKGRFDVVHAFWPIPQSILGMAAKAAAGIPLVSTFFGVELALIANGLWFLRPVLRAIVRASDAVTVISSYTEGRLRQLAPGVRATVIPFGATVSPRPLQFTRPRRAEGAFELLFVGRLVERKGVRVLLEAIARLPAAQRLKLRIVGDGPDRGALESHAAQLRIEDRVLFEGFVPRDELAERFASCDAFILPATVDAKGDTEGLGVVLLEALSYAKPVIASATGGIVDIVRHEQNGLLVPPGDVDALARAIASYVSDPERAQRMGAAGREHVDREFSWPIILDRLEEVYRRVAPRPKRDGTR